MTVLDAEFIKGESRLRSLRANLPIESWSKASYEGKGRLSLQMLNSFACVIANNLYVILHFKKISCIFVPTRQMGWRAMRFTTGTQHGVYVSIFSVIVT